MADEDLRKILCASRGAVRLLVCIPESPAEPLLSMLASLKVEMQILLGHQTDEPQTGKLVVRAPAGMSRNDLLEFTFALCDVVLVAKGYASRHRAPRGVEPGNEKTADGHKQCSRRAYQEWEDVAKSMAGNP